MKTTFLIIAVIGCLALGILGFEQSQKLQSQGKELQAQGEQLAQMNQKLAALEAELKEKQEAIDQAKVTEAKAKILQKTLAESTTAAVAESKKSEKLQQSLDDAKTNNPLHAVASVLKDPKMRDMMKAQQKAVLGPMLDKQYSELFKQLNLTPEQASAFKDLEMKKMLAGTDAGLAMMDDSLDASQRADLTKQVKAQTDEIDAEIKQFLGDNNYQAYQAYEKTAQDRTTMGQFNDQLGGATALSLDQQNQMIQALSDARTSFNWTSGLSQRDAGANGDLASILTDENIAKHISEQEQFDQQFLARAQQILTPDQFKAYKEFQQRQRDLQAASLKMAKGMFGGH